MSGRYGGQRFKRGLIYFGLGKIISSVSGLVAMVLVVRLLSIQDFAYYSVMTSLVEVVTAFSGLGLAHVILRYVPELYVKHYIISLRQLVWKAFFLRGIVLLLVVGVVLYWSDLFAPMIGLGKIIDIFQLFLLLVILRTTCHFSSNILESMLHQGISQFSFSLSSITRLLGMYYLVQLEGVNLLSYVIYVEIVGDALGMLVIFVGIIKSIYFAKSQQAAPLDDSTWLKNNRNKIAKFAIAGYSQHLVGLPFGSNTNKMVGGHLFSSSLMASFGFSQSLYEYIKRYLPAQLLVGLIRPVVISRYSENANFAVAVKTCERVNLINTMVIFAIFTVLASGGTELLQWVSNDKYGFDALLMLVTMLVVLLLETYRLTLEMLVQTINCYHLLIFSNILLSLSVVPAFFLFSRFGAIIFPLMNVLALVLSNLSVKRRLAKADYIINYKGRIGLQLFVLAFLASMWGNAMNYSGVHWLISTSISEMYFLFTAWILCKKEIKAFTIDLIKN